MPFYRIIVCPPSRIAQQATQLVQELKGDEIRSFWETITEPMLPRALALDPLLSEHSLSREGLKTLLQHDRSIYLVTIVIHNEVISTA